MNRFLLSLSCGLTLAESLVNQGLARPEGFEPPTYGFVVRRSIR